MGASLPNEINKLSGNFLDRRQKYLCKVQLDPPQLDEIIKNFKNSSAGHGNISSLITKESDYILEPLTHIFGSSMETGIVPKGL